MAPVDVAMQRSLRAGFLDLLTRSMRPVVQRRNLGDQINDVKTAFSSWDNCMQVAYCKYAETILLLCSSACPMMLTLLL